MTPVYEIAQIEYFLLKFEKEVPDTNLWPTAAAKQLLEGAFFISSVVTETALALVEHVPTDVAPLIENAVRPVFEAGGELIPYAQRVAGTELVEVELPEFKRSYARLLRASIVAWRELAFIEDARPWFLRYSIERAQTLSAARRKLDEAGFALFQRGVPVLPVPPPSPLPPPSPPPPSKAGRILIAVGAGLAGLGTLVLVRAWLRPERTVG